MKLSQIRPCDNCGGPIVPIFNVVSITPAVISPRAANQVLGMSQFFQGSLALAEVFQAEEPVTLASEDGDLSGLVTQIFLCQKCMAGEICLGEIVEKRSQA